MTRRGAARLADVARAAEVGTSIVSRVLNGDPTVSIRPETRERILAAARDLKYRPSALARGLRLSRTMTLGLIVNLSYYQEVADLIEWTQRTAAAAGYVTLIADTADFVGRGEAYQRLLNERRVDGLLIASMQVTDEFVEELREEGLPFVVLNRRVPHAVSVSVEDALGVEAAVAHVVSLGHERIAYLAGPVTSTAGRVSLEPVRRRLAGFRSGMKAAGLRVEANQVISCWIDPDSILNATKTAFARSPPPTALIVWSPAAAVVALAAVHQVGLRLPDELSLAAYNDSPLASYLQPPLTTVRMPLDEMARAGVETLLRIINGERPRSMIVRTTPVLIARGSTARRT